MYKDFVLAGNDIELKGYLWKVDQPEAIICLIHGIGEHAGRYDAIGTLLNENRIDLISMDLRGHGLSPGKRGHAAPRKALLYDIDALVIKANNLSPGIPVYIYGHSMGGNIGLDYRRRGSSNELISGYIITAPWLILVRKISGLLRNAVGIIAKIHPDLLINTGLNASTISTVKKEVEKYQKDPLVHSKMSVLTFVDGMNAAKEILQTKSLNKTKMLLMHGTQDRICSIEGSRILKALENESCTYIEWQDLYHEIHNEKNGYAVIQSMISWIKT
jgi:acylglycerol lipase